MIHLHPSALLRNVLRRSVASDCKPKSRMVSESFSYLRLRLLLVVVSLFFIADSSFIERIHHHEAMPYGTSAQILATSK